ncbi:HAMP domain-containing protein, partial [Aureimonas leprariae]
MLNHLKISTKIISAVLAISLIGLALSAYSAWQMKRIDQDYSYLIDVRDAAIMNVLRASRFTNQTAYAAYKTMAYHGASAEAKTAAAEVEKDTGNVRNLLEKASAALPDAKDDLAGLTATFGTIAEEASDGTASGLKDEDDAARASLAQMDKSVDAYMKQSVALGDRLIADNASRSSNLTSNVNSTIVLTIAGTLLGMVLGIGGAVFISSKGITGPLNLLGKRMKELAAGQLDVPVEGQDRRDEVGAMAKAVQVFKDAANQ